MVGSGDGTGRFQCQGVLLISKVAQQGATVLAVGMGGDWFDCFLLALDFSFLCPSVWATSDIDCHAAQRTCKPKPTNKRNLSLLCSKETAID